MSHSKCNPPEACATHGRCWAHSHWETSIPGHAQQGSQYIKERLAQLKEEKTTMEKHGVVKDESKTKTASVTAGKCPQCGGELTKEGDSHIDHCPKCGTRPFEARPSGTEE